LTSGGHEVIGLRRDASNRLDVAPADGADAVVHLAGENIAARRWTARQKQRILDSRAEVTGRLCADLLKLTQPPRTLLAASAVGFYGSRGDAWLDESDSRGEGFLSDVCAAWEEAASDARAAGVRVAALRFGVVLSPRGGALRLMLPAFRLGVGGRVGPGDQQMSWITLDDAAAAIHHVLMTDQLGGPVNMVAPAPVSNAEFSRVLAGVLRRLALVPAPALALKAALGEMADALLLSSQRVRPRVLEESGFSFRHRDLETGLRHLLGRSAIPAA
ncbi:MAG: TIGR01777 family oxidoreductase, partial [Patescibacteria group bacterium]|nr:TIGR01777 family oxidoreductase [Patescibacteria group bacterium]